jgi:uncharacterized membrane protein
MPVILLRYQRHAAKDRSARWQTLCQLFLYVHSLSNDCSVIVPAGLITAALIQAAVCITHDFGLILIFILFGFILSFILFKLQGFSYARGRE